MCGIIGVLQRSFNASSLSKSSLKPIQHRGPDAEGVYHNGRLSLGHTRLAICDLSSLGGQPLQSHDKRFIIVYNGMIYNHTELRATLEALGARFLSRSDTEVVVEAYRRWGKACVARLRGMFAFALWDSDEQSLFLARDRCGERPLIYYRDDSAFYFASEFKALLPIMPHMPTLNPAIIDMYLHYQYVPEPFTLLKGVYKLPAAHTLSITAEGWEEKPERYWCIEDARGGESLPTDTPGILQCIREGLEDSVRICLRADVPVAVALSGGVDSSALAALAQKNCPEPMHAFSVGYPGRPPYDEREQAKGLADRLGMIFHEVELSTDDFVGYFPSLVYDLDEPVADPAAFGLFAVPRAAKMQGLKILLSGLGGDELFWGYSWVAEAARINQQPSIRTPAALHRLMRRRAIAKRLAKLAKSKHTPNWLRDLVHGLHNGMLPEPSGFLKMFGQTSGFHEAHTILPAWYGEVMRTLSPNNAYFPTDIGPRDKDGVPAAVLRILYDTWLISDTLTLSDRVGMASGVETRAPFLDPALIELVMSLRHRTPDHTLGQKAWLRAALSGILPEEVLTRPKSGFCPPVQEWLTGVVRKYGEVLVTGELVSIGVLKRVVIEKILADFRKGDNTRLFMLYKLTLLEQWIQIYTKQRLSR